MADIKISALPTATTPLTGAELVPIVQSGVTKQTTTSDVLAVPVTSLTASSAVATDASKKLVSVTNTGTGNNVLATSPTLVTPILGTPQSATLTNATGLPISTGVSGLGTGVATALAVNVGTAGSPVVNGGALGTPSSGTVTNLTGTANITATGGASGAIAATTLSASSTVSGTGFSTYLASPPAIGGTAPAAVSATALSYTTTLTGGTGIVNLGSGQFYKDASGNVGIGNASPGQKLDVSGSIKSSGFFIGSTGTTGFAALGTTGTATDGGNFVGRSATSTYNPAGVEIYAGGSERIRVDTSGNVGVGKTPVAGRGLLQVNGDAEVTSLNTGQLAGLRNKIINGGFDIWQRGTSGFAVNTYSADRFFNPGSVTTTSSQGTFTAGNPITGYEPTYYLQSIVNANSAAGDYSILEQRMEDVRTFAGQTCTLSFWGRTTSGTLKTSVEISQVFGTGGSGSVFTTAGAAITLTTTWTRFSVTISVPSISGKTIGTSSFFGFSLWLSAGSTYAARSNSIGNQAGTFQFWGWQAEIGSVATPFEQRPYGMELALCQRYYYRINAASIAQVLGSGYNVTTTSAQIYTPFPVAMRTSPTTFDQSGTATDYAVLNLNTATICTAVPTIASSNLYNARTAMTVASGLTAGDGSMCYAATANAYLGWSAEL